MHPLFLKISFAGYGILGSYFFIEYFKYVTSSISLESIDKSWSFCFLLSCPLYLPFLFNLVTVLTCDEVIVRQGEVMYLKSLKYHTVVSQWCNGTSLTLFIPLLVLVLKHWIGHDCLYLKHFWWFSLSNRMKQTVAQH